MAFFENIIQIGILFFAWLTVLLSFFILAIRLFVTLIEFKLATLAGFLLVPFGLFGKTAFMAERVLGLVISTGVKVLVLAVIVGIGSTIFGEFTSGFSAEPTIGDAMSIVLGALSLLALGLFGPGIANGIVAGGPQLGAGVAAGTGLLAGGAALGGIGAARAGGSALASGARGATATGSGAVTAFQLGAASHNSLPGKAMGGMAAMSRAGGAAIASPLRQSLAASAESGAPAAHTATGGSFAGNAAPTPNGSAPTWARKLRQQQGLRHGLSTAVHAMRAGDQGSSGTSISLSERP